MQRSVGNKSCKEVIDVMQRKGMNSSENSKKHLNIKCMAYRQPMKTFSAKYSIYTVSCTCLQCFATLHFGRLSSKNNVITIKQLTSKESL